ncbi:phosphoethanolamine transferase [Flavobacterium sp. TSSA_36]|uniref:phosphoethanolamine transferase n=1 Tax=Flavobacterium sp. TSSA_36 TaxID=3447669 RepID=UPI003F2C2350
MKFKKTVFKNILLFIISMIILILPDFVMNNRSGAILLLVTLISKITLYLFLFFLIVRILKSFYLTYLVIGILYLLSSCIEIIVVNILGNYITLDNIKALFYTSFPEMLEFSRGFYVYLILSILIFISYVFCLKKFKNFQYKELSRYYFFLLLMSLLMTSIIVPTVLVYNSPIFYSGKNLPKYIFRQYYLKQHPFNVFYRSYEFSLIKYRFNKYKKVKESFNFGVKNRNSNLMPDIVVFVIGERMRYSNWSINGYKRETSPNLVKAQNLISFENHFSNANSTSNSIPLIITQATPQNPELAYSQKTIVSLFKEAGYETTWISNQNVFDYIENKSEVDRVYELYKKGQDDMDIIPVFLKKIHERSFKKQFIVINMLGGHGNLSNDFNFFKPNSLLKNYIVKAENATALINDYDNMIRLQDYVLSQLIGGLEKNISSSFLMFTADHGCNLFDENTNLFGYGSSNPTEKETHIPFFVWTSEKYLKDNLLKINNLKNNKKSLTVNTNVFYTLAEMSNIDYEGFKKEFSIVNSLFMEPKLRSVYANGNVINYDNKKQ